MLPTDLSDALHRHFGHDGFRPGQEDIVRAVLEGENVVAVMPTGGGKSLCYQLPALLVDGVTLVVSPLIALMKDQVDGLQDRGHAAVFVNSSISQTEQEERLRACREGRAKLLYVAPERIASPRFLESLAGTKIARLAIDEAHCISQWGHDFRPDYLRLGELRALIGSPPTAAFTATATERVREDVARQLGLTGHRVFVAGFERPNLKLLVLRPDTVARKYELLFEAIDRADGPCVVYAATRKNVEQVAAQLSARYGKRGRALRGASSHGGRGGSPGVRAYHGGLDAAEREAVQDAFMRGEATILVATSAFGMGVDKSDVRLVAHFDVPGSVEQYYQEAGRAGRDGEPAECVLLYNFADVRIQRFFLDGANPPPELFAQILDRLAQGPAATDTIAADAAVKNEMAVDTALGILRRRGVVVRVPEPGGSSPRDDHWHLVDDRRSGELPVDVDHLIAKRRSDEERLRDICAYAAGSTCRRAFVLRYFGSAEARDRCDACDRCLDIGRPAARALSDDERMAVRIALSGVARADDRYGRARLANFLFGSKSREVVDAGLDRLPTHGKLAHLSLRTVSNLLEALADEGLLKRRAVDGPGSASVLSLTPEGRRVMMENPPLSLSIPDLDGSADGKRGGARRAARGTDAPAKGETGGRRARPAPPAAADPAVRERLRAWRLQEARAAGLPPYTIFPDTTLDALAVLRPATVDDLRGVPGIGPARLERWAAGILAAVGVSAGRDARPGGPSAGRTGSSDDPDAEAGDEPEVDPGDRDAVGGVLWSAEGRPGFLFAEDDR